MIVSQTSLAQTCVPTHYDWAGYHGNFTIYDTCAISAKTGTCPYVLPYNVTNVTQKCGHFVSPAYDAGTNSSRKICTTLGDQPVLTDHGWIDASYLHAGDMIFNPLNGTYVTITSLHHLQGTFTMYDFLLSGNNDFIAYTYLLQGIVS